MMRVAPQPEPDHFDQRVREPGSWAIVELVGDQSRRPPNRQLAQVASSRHEIPGAAFPPYWRRVRDDLRDKYNRVCAFSGMRIHPTADFTVDHMVPKSSDWRLVYEWCNYRLACLPMNRRKREFTDVLDPFCIDDDWFVMDIVEFRVHPGSSLDASRKHSVAATINRLGLNDLDWCETRRQHVEHYREHRMLHIVESLFPFVAKEIRRLGL